MNMFTTQNHHGILVPLFSLRSDENSGIGEFFDLLPLFPWMQKIGFTVLQLLPVNDTGDASSPYSAVSALALHPIYLSLNHLPFLDLVPEVSALLQELKIENNNPRFSYPVIRKNKELFLRYYYAHAKEHIEALAEYQAFIAREPWLDTYARFKAYKEHNGGLAWWDWKEKECATNEVSFHKAVQFLCFSQLERVKREAELYSILLKGDIPILISKDSADVWEHPWLFDLTLNAGAPPDMYNEEGQNWGFPIYNWAEHEKDNFHWWKERLRVAEKFFHMYRIDHIIGLFRIWTIPEGMSAKHGFFLPRDESLWVPQGEKILRMFLFASNMHPVGEDLGVVHPEIRQVMMKLRIPGTKVYRWERKWQQDKSYIPVDEYPKNSLSCISTHDSTSVAEWWELGGEDVETFARFKGWQYHPTLSSEERFEILKDSHTSNSYLHINLLSEYLSLFPELSWERASQDRINIPGMVLESNWTYRFRPTVETIIHHAPLASVMKLYSLVN